MEVSLLIGQFPITLDIERNMNNIYEILEYSDEDDLVVLPEGAVSGYSDDVAFLNQVNITKLENAISELKTIVIKKKIHCIFGSCIFENGSWYNAGFSFSYSSPDFIYRKINLAAHERGIFKAGDKLEVNKIIMRNGEIKIGIQLCREIRFPEQWRWLALNNADMFVYLTNAINGSSVEVWRSHLISRAAENQRFLAGANNAHADQLCPTMLIAPDGQVIEEIVSGDMKFIKHKIDLAKNSNWYIDQCRNDVIRLTDK